MVNWGIIGCGRICSDFTKFLRTIANAEIVAVASRDISRSQTFITAHELKTDTTPYGSYNDLVNDAKVKICSKLNMICLNSVPLISLPL